MKTKILRLLAVCFVVAAGVLFWLLLSRKPDPEPRAVAKVPGAAQSVPDDAGAARLAEPWPEFGTPEFKRMALERGQKWLESRGRDAASLIAAWDVTGEEALLIEAAEKFPNDPRVCMAMIGHSKNDAAKARPWIDRLIAVEPQNPEGHYLKSWAFMEGGDRAGAIAALREAVTVKSPRDTHLRDRILTVREAALASGAGVGDAARVALAAPLMNGLTYQSLPGAIKALRAELADAKAAGSDERLLEMTGLGFAMAKNVSGSISGTILDTLIAGNIERAMLAELSDDTEVDDRGRTVAQMKEEADARRNEIQAFLKRSEGTDDFLHHVSDAVVAEYTDRFVLHGEQAARTWLMAEAVQAKGTPEQAK